MKISQQWLTIGLSSILSFCCWADHSGIYDCHWTLNGEPREGKISLQKSGDTYEFDLMWKHEKDKVHDTLVQTNDPNQFNNAWKTKDFVGVSLWTFSGDKLTLKNKHLLKDSKDYVDELINCQLMK